MRTLERRKQLLLKLLDECEAEGRDPRGVEDQLEALERSQKRIRIALRYGIPLLGCIVCAGLAFGLYTALYNHPPTASIALRTSDHSVGTAITFDASGSADRDGEVMRFVWDFGDGTVQVEGARVLHTYAAAGTYPVALRVTDNRGANATAARDVSVRPPNLLPQSAFRWTPERATTESEISFDGAQSRDPDGRLTLYEWDFGDGTQARGSRTAHSFGRSGTYSVSLTVTDDREGSAVTRHRVAVSDPPPPNRAPTAGTIVVLGPTGSDSFLGEGWVSLAGIGASDPDGDTLAYTWRCSDGEAASGSVWIRYLTHKGRYRAFLTVTDEHGLSASVSTTFDY